MQPLLEPIRIGPLLLPNRVVMAPLTRSRTGDARVPGPLQALYYAQRASAGLIISEATQISERGRGYIGTPGIHSDAQVEGWRLVTDAVHRAGGRIFLQLWHVGRVSHSLFQPNRELPVAPSAIAIQGEVTTPEGRKPFETPRALETAEIPGVVREYADAARRAKDAGFDGVEIHGANGYLIDQFLRDGTNRRTDAYGGSIENRARFLLEVADAVIAVWGAERVGVRFSPNGRGTVTNDTNPRETFGHAAAALSRLGIAYLHVIEALAGPFASESPRVTPHLRERFRGPLMLNGAYGQDTGNDALARGEGDLVSFGIPFISNPDLPVRFERGATLADADRATFYTAGVEGYTDYPSLAETP